MNFRKFRKFKKNAKALSPVIATIILIAVTVAVSVVVAAWMGALTIGFMGNAEQASITNVVLTNSNATAEQAVCTIQNTGSSTVSITSATIDGNTATISAPTVVTGTQSFATWVSGQQVPIGKGNTVTITLTIKGTVAAPAQFSNSAQYTIKLMTAKGNTETNQATYSGP
ncbi:MAG: archaellin/type IV pilin N-terminal domain-containing protein [Candidatus Bathyarchaeia archaeon]|jgi:flagellin-like protein